MSKNKHEWISKNPKALKLLRQLVDQKMSDPKIQARIYKECGYEWSIATISRARRNLGIKKTPGAQPKTNTAPQIDAPPHGLTLAEKEDWYKDQLKITHHYKILHNQFTEDEIEIYLSEYGRVCCQFEDIVATEFYQIERYLSQRILINRQMASIKNLLSQQVFFSAELQNNPLSSDPSAQERQAYSDLLRRIDSIRTELSTSHTRHDNLLSALNKIESNLASRRKDRIEELRGGKQSFFDLVSEFQRSEKAREQQGKYAELTRIAADEIEAKLRAPGEFPDGTVDSIIVDELTEFDEES